MRNCPICQTSYPAGILVCPKDGASLRETDSWVVGNTIRGKYRLLDIVGTGGMATVYRAEHIHFHEIYAVKAMNREAAEDGAVAERFLREAVMTRRLQHPNAVRVEDIDRAEDGRPFMVMEFLEGQTLYDLLHYEGPLDYSRVRTIAAQVASALHAAHDIGIIHRDIKPSNITVVKTPGGEVAKVLDFGIAKLKEARIDSAAENDFTLTVAGMVVGTPAYVSPEQAQGKRGNELDSRSDVYSFAVVVYQMLTGQLPVRADSEEQYVIAHANNPPEDIRLYLPDFPKPVADLLMNCLSKNPNDRPADPRELTNEMGSWEMVDEGMPAAPAAVPLAILPRAKRFVSSSARWAIVCLGGALILFVAALISFIQYGASAPAKKAQPPPRVQPSYLSLSSGDMILIPAGPAALGENNATRPVSAFYIDKTEVSTRSYLQFCEKTARSLPPGISQGEGDDLPVRNVDLSDAKAFAAWAHKRLPTAAEWEKAARGTQGQHFPWGNELGVGMARFPVTPQENETSLRPQAVPSPVDSFPQGASSYGVLNLVGNVWEWVESPVQIRGGGYMSYPAQLNVPAEAFVYAGQSTASDTKRPDLGFRCARD